MKILYAASLHPNASSLYRKWALERLGHTVIGLNVNEYSPQNPVLQKVLHRAQIGPWVTRLNRDIVRTAERERPDVFWADKLLSLRVETLESLRKADVVSVSYNADNAFGPRRDPGWRLYMQSIRHFDLHVTPRERNLKEYREYGARDVMRVQFAYEPTLQFPPSTGWSDKDRDREVSFIGTPYDDRATFLTQLWREYRIPLTINGGPQHWLPVLSAESAKALYEGRELVREEYRQGIWRSRINLSFVTHSNLDDYAHKSFEIAACGGFLLAERSQGHLERFEEDREAVFFSNIEECAAKIARYLPNQAARNRIAAAGRERAVRSGYGNDTQMGRIVDRLKMVLRQR